MSDPMDLLYSINYAILAVFICLFIVEAGIGILSLADYKSYRDRIRRYLMPIWGMDGTFAVFYLVNLMATYPGIAGVTYAYIVPVLIGAALFLSRNAFVAYSEYIGDPKYESACMKVYGASTIVLSFMVISVFGSALSGAGVTVSRGSASVSLQSMLASPFSILVFVSAALVALFITASYFEVKRLYAPSYAMLPIALSIAVFAMWEYVPYMARAAVSDLVPVAASAVLMLIPMALKALKSRFAALAALLWLFMSINLFGYLQYPYLLGGSAKFTDYITNPASAGALALVTAIGGAVLAVSIAFFLYISYVRKDDYYGKPQGKKERIA